MIARLNAGEALSLEIGVASGREWVRAEGLSLLLRGMARRARTLRLSMNIQHREVCDAKDVIDQALAERDERQARIDAANLIATRAIDEGLPADEALRMIARTLEGKTARALSGEALRDVEERDDASEETQ